MPQINVSSFPLTVFNGEEVDCRVENDSDVTDQNDELASFAIGNRPPKQNREKRRNDATQIDDHEDERRLGLRLHLQAIRRAGRVIGARDKTPTSGLYERNVVTRLHAQKRLSVDELRDERQVENVDDRPEDERRLDEAEPLDAAEHGGQHSAYTTRPKARLEGSRDSMRDECWECKFSFQSQNLSRSSWWWKDLKDQKYYQRRKKR